MDAGDGKIFSLLVKKPVHAILLIFKQVKHQYNLQYFSYRYHHYNEHYISKFWQVRNLRLPFHIRGFMVDVLLPDVSSIKKKITLLTHDGSILVNYGFRCTKAM